MYQFLLPFTILEAQAKGLEATLNPLETFEEGVENLKGFYSLQRVIYQKII